MLVSEHNPINIKSKKLFQGQLTGQQCLPQKPDKQTLELQNQKTQEHRHLETQHTSRDRQEMLIMAEVPGAHRTANMACQAAERHCLKQCGTVRTNTQRLFSDIYLHALTCVYACAHTHVPPHTHHTYTSTHSYTCTYIHMQYLFYIWKFKDRQIPFPHKS